MNKRFLLILFTLLLAAFAIALYPCPQTATPTTLTGHTMGGSWSIKLSATPSQSKKLHSQITQRLAQLDQDLSHWRESSALCKFNNAPAHTWIPVPADLAQIAAIAQQISENSRGAFDITIAPLVNIWGFGPVKHPHDYHPTSFQVAEAQSKVFWRNLQVQLNPPRLLKRDPDTTLDLGGIAKGHAADVIINELRAANITDALVQIGGEIRAIGAPRNIGIESPVADTRRVLATLSLQNQALSTSGGYRNFRDTPRGRISHAIDPCTGYPILHDLASVSVVHDSAALADAWATALLVLGPDEGFRHAQSNNLKALFVLPGKTRFQIRTTTAARSIFHFTTPVDQATNGAREHPP